MEEFDIQALLSSNEKTLIRLLEDYATTNHIVAYVLDNAGDLKSDIFGNTSNQNFDELVEMKNMNEITDKHLDYNLAYADDSLRVASIGQIVGKVCVVWPNTDVSSKGLLTAQLREHCDFLKRLIESLSRILIDNHGINAFMIKYPVEVDDIIDELNDEDNLALQQLKKLSTSNEAIISAIEYIDENLDKHLTLDQVSSKVFLSDYYFSKLFKRETKLSFSVYLNARKIQQAMIILKQTSHSISEVSDELGFTRISYFSQTFKKYTGYTPSEFRNEDYLEL
ncbi:helix-turn-helix domain-containing protein [Companilactobacillus sp.]|jgi:AraC-like DNA-binding protein|uniref:helix-turn-helix domain-containing protein n=1 Tax=Companilactobacillus sp. TaxID=2767905 RepID=UPI0025C2AA35|nr:AraC family transcriptional regulator [Companilactobacillus sp.]MCH4009083.1 AraC family transcriptional regulator [Companilactobacillus sp.]MCH4050738.1 AraC family transcriptional regulator [Companilactobacillus sp.]MCH4077025.1 AraC family transcriptional regulator [Companilactobacillus sp.]MCH4125601.1 AraC family transcriptional regulator [Companilactobacillus sp.]MCI1311310.1 AraC family transcriptional regulator [Companilactobacillus sp.]